MLELRNLQFKTLHEAVDDARQLVAHGYVRQGNWSLGQICRHLALVQESSIKGYPAWMSLFAPLRPLMRRWLLPKLLRSDSPRGIRTASIFDPAGSLDDANEVEAFSASVERLVKHSGDFAPHPAFGRMPRCKILEIHTAHAAHHLRFLRKVDEE